MRGARSRRPQGGDRVLQRRTRSIWWWSGRKCRCAPASSTIWKRPASRRSARANGRRGWKAPKASPRTCARPTRFRPRPMSASRAPAAAKDYVRKKGAPIVVKADGLAAGKGVVVAETIAEAEAAIDMMFGGGLGAPAWEIVIEDCLVGEEASFFALCDGETAIALGLGAGPQARRRRRQGAQHRRHGRLFAGADHDAGDEQARDGRDHSSHRARDEGDGRALQGRAVRRADDHQDWPATDRIQCPLRRSGMPGADAAADVGPGAGADGRARRAIEEFRSALVSGRGADRGDGGQGLSRRLRQGLR